jgi:hypothetical protein
MKILALPEVRQYFYELSKILYNNDYFGHLESAEKYIDELFADIENNLHHKQKKKAPEYFSKYGNNLYYAVFKKNNTTQWYVFFETYVEQQTYVITYIGNNHTVSQHL